ncbi:MAG: alpha-E domain-containing protein, partial [Treponema sp.]|nr:alpha-E domain-containing protein [Treponema sp.]
MRNVPERPRIHAQSFKISALIYAYDNAIVLREDIKSETLAYVEMCVREMERCAAKNDDAYELRPVTDSLMAFWGSVDERIFRRDIRNMIKAGWYLETV